MENTDNLLFLFFYTMMVNEPELGKQNLAWPL